MRSNEYMFIDKAKIIVAAEKAATDTYRFAEKNMSLRAVLTAATAATAEASFSKWTRVSTPWRISATSANTRLSTVNPASADAPAKGPGHDHQGAPGDHHPGSRKRQSDRGYVRRPQGISDPERRQRRKRQYALRDVDNAGLKICPARTALENAGTFPGAESDRGRRRCPDSPTSANRRFSMSSNAKPRIASIISQR